MKHPELIKKVGKDKYRHALGLFQCPLCPSTFIARIDQVVDEHTKSCGCRKKKNFVEHSERRVKATLTSQALARLFSERCQGATKVYLIKKYGIRPSEYPTAVRLAQEAYLEPVVPQRSAVDVKNATMPAVAEQASLVSTDASKQPLVEPHQQTIINVSGDYIMNQHPADKPREIKWEETDAGYTALEAYVRRFRSNPPDEFDLKAWAQSKQA